MKNIVKIKLHNFKRFATLQIEFNSELNLLIGDNEAGKSSVLTAIDLVLSGSRSKVETYGLESLMTTEVVEAFLNGRKEYGNLPKLYVELYLSDQQNADLNGNANSDHRVGDGLVLCCEPDDDLSHEIAQILAQPGANFPFEYYTINFHTFSGQSYTGYKRYLRHVLIDSSQINNEYATREYVKSMYQGSTTDVQRYGHANEYRSHKNNFTDTVLDNVNAGLQVYQFGVRSSTKANLATDITLNEGNINIENKGKGKQCFIKTDFALNRNPIGLDVILLEEPENHLSHLNMKKLIERIGGTNDKQLFVSTHNSLISTRLDLRKAILLNSIRAVNTRLRNLPADTARFFMKAPDNNVIEFVLSTKVILVEGDAEYILMDQFCRMVTGRSLDAECIHVISVDGTSFKRYLHLARELGIRVAVITDNDGDHQVKVTDNYAEFNQDNIGIFADTDNLRSTFEICIYVDNQAVCDELFNSPGRRLSIQQYMLKNKTESAFELLDKRAGRLQTPDYIRQAIEWLRQ